MARLDRAIQGNEMKRRHARLLDGRLKGAAVRFSVLFFASEQAEAWIPATSAGMTALEVAEDFVAPAMVIPAFIAGIQIAAGSGRRSWKGGAGEIQSVARRASGSLDSAGGCPYNGQAFRLGDR